MLYIQPKWTPKRLCQLPLNRKLEYQLLWLSLTSYDVNMICLHHRSHRVIICQCSSIGRCSLVWVMRAEPSWIDSCLPTEVREAHNWISCHENGLLYTKVILHVLPHTCLSFQFFTTPWGSDQKSKRYTKTILNLLPPELWDKSFHHFHVLRIVIAT